MKSFLRLSYLLALVALPACGGKKGCCSSSKPTEELVVQEVTVLEECQECNHEEAPRVSGVETALNLK